MAETFRVLATPCFMRLYRKLAEAHPDLPSIFQEALMILASDPYNRTRQYSIRKLVNVKEDDGQYRLRVARWRFRYDIDGQDVVLKYCGLRREDTYR